MLPLHYPGKIVVEAGVEFIKTTSFGLHYRILNFEGQVCAEAHDVIVYYNFNTNEKAALPGDFKLAVSAIEGKVFN